jgi:hypothetical protein
MARVRAFLDKYIEKFISRKFLAWLTATYLVATHALTSEDWVAVTLTYIGAEALVDLAVRWKHGGSSDPRLP